MADEKKCPHCSKPVPTTAPGGVCPGCMLEAALAQTEGPGALMDPPSPAEIAPLFPQLEILECLGRGGMGVVYKARQTRLNRLVALKILAHERDPDGRFSERFIREAQALARLNHPSIVTVHDFGEAGGHCYLLMEHVDGVNLRQLLQGGKLKPEQALTIVPAICEALQYAHEHGIVHRDIKPENILVDRQGRVKIADFGIAKMMGADSGQAALTGAKDVVGTPHYMAPEQVEQPRTVDHRADIFSLGVVFYEMLTGELPLGRFAPPSQKVRIDVRLDEVVLHALEKEPSRRYQTANLLKTEVETIAAGAGSVKNTGNQLKTMKKQTMWIAVTAIVAGVVCLVGVCVWLFLPRGNAERLSREGWQLWQARKLDQAVVKFQQAVKVDPTNTDAWNGLGWASLNSGHPKEAEQAFLKVIAIAPDHPAALNGLGQLNLAAKNYAVAEKYLLQAAPRAPAAWYGLARIYLLQGKYEDAQKWAQKIVDFGQGDEYVPQMLQAAREKKLNNDLRAIIEPQ
jgi:tRNA A-37 threonylcarbamoyl transferase component Bud32/cytochrome c-type biogenesis protein CcmH/NrfG